MKTSTKNELKITAAPGSFDCTIEREFNAPREMVFNAFADPEIVKLIGPDRLTAKMYHYDFRSGGSYRYAHIDDKGNAHTFNGCFHEVATPEHIIQTFEYENLPERGHVTLDTMMFETLPGNRTKLVIHSICRSVTDRDAMMQSGMETGLEQGYAKLDALFEKNLNL
jgi:uncharacterized protein YndB with AHSA1/START domain